MKSGRGGRGSWGGAKERGAYCGGNWGVEGVGGGAKEGAEGRPTKNRRDLSFPKPDPVWAPCHPKIHQNTTKKGKISPGVQTSKRKKEKCASGEGRGNLKIEKADKNR